MNHIQHAQTLYEMHRYAQADQAIGQCLQHDPNDVQALVLASLIKLQLEQTKRAHHFANLAIGLAPDNSDVHHTKSIICLGTVDFTDALKHIDEALRLEPNESDHHRIKSVIYHAMKNHQKALQTAKDAVGLSPECDSCLFQLARCYYELKSYVRTREILLQTLRINPEHAQALSYLGIMSLTQNDYTLAAQQLQAALEKRPDDIEVQEAWKEILSARYWYYRYPSNLYRIVSYKKQSVVFLCYYLFCILSGVIAYAISGDGGVAVVTGILVAISLPFLHHLNHAYIQIVSSVILSSSRSTRRMLNRTQRVTLITMVVFALALAINLTLHYWLAHGTLMITIRLFSVVSVMVVASFACNCLLSGILWIFIITLISQYIYYLIMG